jgi:hypothetical protein
LPAKLTPDQEAKIEDFYVKLAASKIPHPWAALKDITWGGGEPVEGLLKELSPQIEAMFTKEQKAAMKELQEWKRK